MGIESCLCGPLSPCECFGMAWALLQEAITTNITVVPLIEAHLGDRSLPEIVPFYTPLSRRLVVCVSSFLFFSFNSFILFYV